MWLNAEWLSMCMCSVYFPLFLRATVPTNLTESCRPNKTLVMYTVYTMICNPPKRWDIHTAHDRESVIYHNKRNIVNIPFVLSVTLVERC